MKPRTLAAVCAVLWILASTASLISALVMRYRRLSVPFEYPSLIPNFLEPSECDAVVEAAQGKGMKPSTVVSKGKGSKVDDTRTSMGSFLAPGDSQTVDRIIAKISDLLSLPPSHFEKMQVVSYEKGQRYDAHYDACDSLPRLYTVLIYLSDDFEGGHTLFPNCGVDVTPHKGMAVVWRNIDSEGRRMDSSFHQAQEVTGGTNTKWACNIWAHAAPRQK